MKNHFLFPFHPITLLSLSAGLLLLPPAAWALTIENEITADYVRQHPKEFTVQVTKKKDGLIHFKITHDVPDPMYHVAHLSIYHDGKLIATSDTPAFGKKHGNTFYFAIAPDDLADAKFDLSDSQFGGSADDPVPFPGSMIYKFKLLTFVPER